jgi:GNAT superfamily N-acetyltransferase
MKTVPDIQFVEHRGALSKKEINALFALWNAEYPTVVHYSDVASFEQYLTSLENLKHRFYVVDNQIIGWCLSFVRNGNPWFGMIIDRNWQGRGLGSKFIQRSQAEQDEMHGWAVPTDHYLRSDGEQYKSPLDFYRKNGFTIHVEDKLKQGEFERVKIIWKRHG